MAEWVNKMINFFHDPFIFFCYSWKFRRFESNEKKGVVRRERERLKEQIRTSETYSGFRIFIRGPSYKCHTCDCPDNMVSLESPRRNVYCPDFAGSPKLCACYWVTSDDYWKLAMGLCRLFRFFRASRTCPWSSHHGLSRRAAQSTRVSVRVFISADP